jgi:hypothetical protein
MEKFVAGVIVETLRRHYSNYLLSEISELVALLPNAWAQRVGNDTHSAGIQIQQARFANRR